MTTSDLDDGLLADPAVEAGEVGTTDEEETGPYFRNVYVFVEEFLAVVYARPSRAGSSWRWCPRWWAHPEAVARLEALWQAFEALRQEPGTSAAVWWRDFVDPTMVALSDPQGTFAGCSTEAHKVPPALPVERPADALWESQ